MSGAELGLAVSVFLACAVEAVEALTIVLAVGSTRSWSSAIGGALAAGGVLAVLVAALGPALTSLPIDALRVAVGGLLLVFGLQWLRKAILRSAGLKAKHDEREEYERERAAARGAAGRRSGFDPYAFTTACQGVLLEGLEVAFIVLGFGANQHRIGLAAAAAGVAVLAVVAAGAAVRGPLAKVPENTIKFAVGVLLTSFGTFWGAEGAGARWPGGDAALLVIVPCVLLAALALASHSAGPHARRRHGDAPAARPPASASPTDPGYARLTRRIEALAVGVWEFVVGEDWRTALVVVLALALTALLAATGAPAWWTMPAAVLAALTLSVRRAATAH